MHTEARRSWLPAVVLLGVGYASVGIVFAVPSTDVRAWRLAAWVVSAIAYAAHILYERFRLENPPRSAALHIALAVALGALGLAVSANIHSLAIGATIRPRLLLSLGIWPLITALPAYLVALGINAVLSQAFPNGQRT